ncbi:hypothetical protein [Pseudoalteromonas luteoviolacea]|uniref:hypothetical protein n=1 Tax=Pseudoalteromonas luteoviolacea TaxID=43657 RepID=UPI001154A247|nr:hypothetical protein [Pseudoalteromonas luteoviolacea]TQF70311.1 hypothetical protein FLM44_04245 [Pseudoalteromonas luteoviolacea]
MKRLIALLSVAVLSYSTISSAAPTPFEYKDLRKGASEKKMRSIYSLIKHSSDNPQEVRLAILNAMSQTKGTPWLLEGEGDGYILARWDYKGHAIIHRIEYDEKAVQIKYDGGVNDYKCELLVDNYCYKTHRNYYKYNISLVKQLRKALSSI